MGSKVEVDHFMLAEDRDDFRAQLSGPTNAKDILHLQLMLQNQFITPEELSRLHLHTLAAQHARKRPQAEHASDITISRVLAQLEEGSALIEGQPVDAADLMDSVAPTEQQKKQELCRMKQEDRQMVSQLLYGRNKNKQSLKEASSTKRLLSAAEHNRFIRDMKKDNRKRKEMQMERSRAQLERSQQQLEAERKSCEEKRISSIQKKKDSIKENLRKMRQNHDKFLASEKESHSIFDKIRKKKRIHQEMKQGQDAKFLEASRIAQQRLLDNREQGKSDMANLKEHQKSYLLWKEQKSLEKSRSKKQESMPIYKPPPRPKKLNKLLEEENKVRNKVSEFKKMADSKMQRLSQYSSLIKQRMKAQSPKRSKTIATDREDTSADHRSLRQQIDRVTLGNQYMNQAKLKGKKRSKTEERYFNPEDYSTAQTTPVRQKVRVSTLDHIPEQQRQPYIDKKRGEEIERLLKLDQNMSDRQKIRRIKYVDDKVYEELRRNNNKKNGKNSEEVAESNLSLLLGTIRAKINLIGVANGN